MKTERLYPILYDLSVAIGAEVSEKPLMKRVMQRLMFHTGLPVSLWLGRVEDRWSIRTAVGLQVRHHQLGEEWPDELTSCWLTNGKTLQLLKVGDDWRSALALRVDDDNMILLLSRRDPDTMLPWAEALSPVMGNLHRSLYLCRINDERTRRLTSEIAQRSRQLQTSEKRFFALVHQAPISIQIFRADGTCLMVNPAWEKLWHSCFSDLDDYNVLHDEQLKKSGRMEEVRRAFAGEQVHVDAHLYTVQADGTDGPAHSLWLRANLFPLRDDAGTVTHVVAIHEDITWWKEADDRLKKSERRYRRLIEVIPDGVGLCRDGRWLMVNPAMVRAFGADSADTLIGSPVQKHVHPEDRTKMPDPCYESDEINNESSALIRLIRMDGSEFLGETQSLLIEDVDGGPVVMLIIRDVSERVAAERENSLLRAAIEQSTEPTMVLDADGFVLLANPASAKLHGVENTDLKGLQIAELRGGRQGDALHSEIRSTIMRGEAWHGEVILKKNRKKPLVARRISPVFDGEGATRWQILVDRDISEERRRQEKMAHVQRLESLGVLAGGIAHDFNNLLGIIMGNVSLARSTITSRDPIAASLKNIEETSHRAANLCNQMLAYSGKGKFVVQPINLSELVEEMSQLLEVSISKKVSMRYELTPLLPSVKADTAQLQQVIMNLVINANEAIGEQNGTIVVATGQVDADVDYLRSSYVEEEILEPGPYVWLEVSDTGCGMDSMVRERLFEPFFTTKFTGRGLGMSAILGIIRGHNGTIKVYSEAGKGTTIKVLFPAVGDLAPVSLTAMSDSAEQTIQATGTVLVVDDEEMLRNVAAAMLKSGGYEVILAEDGVDAVAKLEKYRDTIDCVLLDMKMPRMGGEEAFTEMRRIKPEIKVLLSSGYNEQTATNRFAGKGLAGFVQKPYTLKKILAKIAETMAG